MTTVYNVGSLLEYFRCYPHAFLFYGMYRWFLIPSHYSLSIVTPISRLERIDSCKWCLFQCCDEFWWRFIQWQDKLWIVLICQTESNYGLYGLEAAALEMAILCHGACKNLLDRPLIQFESLLFKLAPHSLSVINLASWPGDHLEPEEGGNLRWEDKNENWEHSGTETKNMCTFH